MTTSLNENNILNQKLIFNLSMPSKENITSIMISFIDLLKKLGDFNKETTTSKNKKVQLTIILILCDEMILNLFGKPYADTFEILMNRVAYELREHLNYDCTCFEPVYIVRQIAPNVLYLNDELNNGDDVILLQSAETIKNISLIRFNNKINERIYLDHFTRKIFSSKNIIDTTNAIRNVFPVETKLIEKSLVVLPRTITQKIVLDFSLSSNQNPVALAQACVELFLKVYVPAVQDAKLDLSIVIIKSELDKNNYKTSLLENLYNKNIPLSENLYNDVAEVSTSWNYPRYYNTVSNNILAHIEGIVIQYTHGCHVDIVRDNNAEYGLFSLEESRFYDDVIILVIKRCLKDTYALRYSNSSKIRCYADSSEIYIIDDSKNNYIQEMKLNQRPDQVSIP